MGIESKVFKLRTSVVCVHEGAMLTFVGVDPTSQERKLFHPGGKPDAGESLVDCAVRETLEETGYRVEVLPESEVVKRYDYLWDGVLYECETHFFAARLLDDTPCEVNDTSYNKGVYWCSLDSIAENFSYCAPVLAATNDLCRFSFADGLS